MSADDWDTVPTPTERHLPAVVNPADRSVTAAETLDLAPRAWKLAQRIAATPFAPKGLAGKPESILACMLTGNELGLPLMTSLSKVHVVDGRPGLASETMRALVLAAGHEVWIEDKTNTAVTVGGKRAGSSREQRVTWTLDDATKAGLANKDNWRKYPRAMLTARAMAELCRDLFPDVIGGLYAVEELADGFEFDAPRSEEAEVEGPPPRKAIASKARKRATTKAKAAAEEGPEPEPPPLPDDDIVDAVIVDEVIETYRPSSREEDPPALPDDEPAPTAPAGVPKEHADYIPPVETDAANAGTVVEAELDIGHADEEVDNALVERTRRAQRIAMSARDLDLDRAEVISAVTGGLKTSARELDDIEADLVIEALRRLKVGDLMLTHVDDEPTLVERPAEAPPAPSTPDEGSEARHGSRGPATGLAWRALIKENGRTLADTLREASRIAGDLGIDAPTDATALSEADGRLRADILRWLEGAK